MPLLGQLALWLAVLLAVWGGIIGWAGARQDRPDLQESARRASVVLQASLLVALGCLVAGVLWQDFRLAYVAAHADRATARHDAWAVLLDGAGGRWMVGAALLAMFLVGGRVRGRVLALGCAVCGLVVAGILVLERPFAPLTYTPVDGQGLSQTLYDVDTRVGLLLRCAAYAVAVIPLLQLVARDVTQRWVAVAWLVLTLFLGWTLWLASRDAADAGWLKAALWRPAALLWVAYGAWLHLRWRRRDVATFTALGGAVLVVVGLAAATRTQLYPVQLRPGATAPAGPFMVTYLASSTYPAENQIITQGLLELRRGDERVGRVAALRRQQIDVFGRERFEVALRAGRKSDLRETITARWVADSAPAKGAEFVLAIVPLAPWLWLGWGLLALSGIAALGREEHAR